MEILSYENFKDRLVADLQQHYGGSEEVMVNSVIKPNIGELTQVSLNKPDMTPITALSIEQLYEEYERCGSFSDVFERTAAALSMTPGGSDPPNMRIFMNPDTVLEKAFCQVIGVKGNEAFLDIVPHKRHDDLSVIYRLLIGRAGPAIGSVKLTHNNFDRLGIPVDVLHERALANTEKFFPAEVADISKFLPFPEASGFTMQMLVLTHQAKTHGAIAALYPGLLQELSEKMGKDLLLLPSSVHEFMVLPDTGNYEVKELRNMVKEINMKMVDKEDRLTDSVYRFKCGDKDLSLCKDDNRRSRGRDDR